jgi:putative ABC transport system permease protein
MLKNHLLIALRRMRRQKGYAAINVLGLAIGVAACLLILHYVLDERAFDRFHGDGDRIYRLVTEGEFPAVGWPFGRILEEGYAEVEEVVYMRTWPTFPIVHEGERYYESLRYAEASFFEVFDFPLVDGDRATALADPHTIVLSEALARKLFGEAPALGQTLRLGNEMEVSVTGVARVPRHSHIKFDGVLSMETLREVMGPADFDEQMASGWGNVNMINYVLLREGADAGEFAAKIRDLPAEHIGEMLGAMGWTMQLGLEPLHGIYLQSPYGSALGPSGDIAHVYLLSVVALFILLLAAVNFVNLATARSAERAREVGLRKAMGSSRGELVRQFLAESLLTSGLAVILGAGLAWLALPFFADLADRGYAVGDLFSLSLAAALLALVVLIGLLAGLYPALALSGFRPLEVLRGSFSTSRRGVRLRQSLVVLQFGVSSVLLVATIVVLSQLHFMQSQHPGFDREQVLVVDARRAPAAARAVLKDALAAHSAVQRVSATFAVPGRSGWQGQLSFPEGVPEGQSVSLEYVPVDHDYVATLGLEIVAGRAFDPSFATDAETAVMINEAAVRAAGWASPAEAVGRRFTSPGSGKPEGVVIGVVRDHHHHGLRERIGPIMYGLNPWALGLLAVRLDAAQAASVVGHLERTWEDHLSGYPYEYAFLDEAFAHQYGEERRLARIFGTFALLAVLIGCLGLFGLAAFTAQQRTKEVGVRKVLGATVPQLVTLLSKDFLKLVVVAFVMTTPVAYWAMGRWLEGFAYRIEIGPGVFLAAGLVAVAAALLTVSGQALRAATADPVEALRSE